MMEPEASPADLLSQLQERKAADLANEVARTYEVVEQVYTAALGALPPPTLSASANPGR